MDLERISVHSQNEEASGKMSLRSYAFIGGIAEYDKVNVEAREFLPVNGAAAHFIEITVISSQREASQSCLIDAEKVEEFARSLELLGAADFSRVKFPQSELHYNFQDDLKIVVFNDKKGKLQFVVYCGQHRAYFTNIKHILALRDHVLAAAKFIENHKTER